MVATDGVIDVRAWTAAERRPVWLSLGPALGLALLPLLPLLPLWPSVTGVTAGGGVSRAMPAVTAVAAVSEPVAMVRPAGGEKAPSPVRPSAGGARPVPGTPCTTAARACVNLTAQKAWLLNGGAVVLGPVPIHSGGPDHATPQGTFAVSWKDKDHVSAELGGMPMPDAVFFAAGGIAFHEGPLTRSSAGCVHLDPTDAAAFYAALHRGDQVQVRAPGGDPASGVGVPATGGPAAAERASGAGGRSATPHPGADGRAPAAKPGPGGGSQRGIPGVPAIGPAPRG